MRPLTAAAAILILLGQPISLVWAEPRPTTPSRALPSAPSNASPVAEPLPGATKSGSAVSTAPTIWLVVVPGVPALDADAIRASIATELGLPVRLDDGASFVGKVTVVGLPGPAVRVRYESEDGTTRLERQVALPIERNRRSIVIAWVVGNLVRNEAAEILTSMGKRPASDAKKSIAQDVAEPTAEAPKSADDAADTKSADERVMPEVDSRQALGHPMRPPHGSIAVSGHVVPTTGRATRIVHLALFSPTLALHRDAEGYRYRLSLGAAYSHIGALDGVGLTLLVHRIDGGSRGVDFAGIWSRTRGSVGVVMAGLGSDSEGDLIGTELSGLLALRRGCVLGAQVAGFWASANADCASPNFQVRASAPAFDGLQFAGVVARVDGRVRGMQVAGIATTARDGFDGAQIAGGISYSGGAFVGGQLALGGNIGRSSARGIQLAGAFNHADGDLTGTQVAMAFNQARDLRGMQLGLVNSARDVSGIQLGLVNLARRNDGFALGLFNWSETARLRPTYFFQTPGLHSLGYRNSSGHAASSMSFGYDPTADVARTHFALGVRSEVGRLATGLEFGYGWVLENFSTGPRRDRAHELDLIATASLEILRDVLSIYGGGGMALAVAGIVANEPRGLAQVGVSFF